MKSLMTTFRPEFVERIPEVPNMERDVLYISISFSTTSHLCPCGCGGEVVSKISPARWALTYDGESVSLSPSISNVGLPCRSHYFITRNQVRWAGYLSEKKIKKARKKDQEALDRLWKRTKNKYL